MSWQSYVDTSLVGAGFVNALILGTDGSTWATSKGFALKAGEEKTIVANFTSPDKFTANGIIVAGVKYLALKTDTRSVYGKQGTGGIVLVKTGKCVLIAVYNDKLTPGAAANIVEKLGDYLIDAGY
ncbi:hypothetical protein SAMD00019534_075850 [Acytostelium subglobosum LB1]|uniref:hypothetical protein n=1 Tax=Acytostelium subglobosum LB1 TaxID=1410327 RepID=UPI0006450EF6|nr:hypothetical protein SAMD00019534_075850 [Acytostelium subglobosum LB1]GAM24410.1 hypothetical protein SAMD00019534_075850 [Acytostelium subglobosum LB1]|eukprot:XP_012752736.1 hypothetical protein SAMD00019534_075850 [Acytostelium subglobosum LB1]